METLMQSTLLASSPGELPKLPVEGPPVSSASSCSSRHSQACALSGLLQEDKGIAVAGGCLPPLWNVDAAVFVPRLVEAPAVVGQDLARDRDRDQDRDRQGRRDDRDHVGS